MDAGVSRDEDMVNLIDGVEVMLNAMVDGSSMVRKRGAYEFLDCWKLWGVAASGGELGSYDETDACSSR